MSQNIDSEVNALREGWTYLEPLNVPTASVKKRSAVFLREIAKDGEPCSAYVKIYANKQHPFQRLFRTGRSRTEVRNLLFFRSLGIATPKVLAWGERRNAIGRLVEEFIITQAEADTLQLDDFVKQHYPDSTEPEQEATRIQIARQLGEWTRRMHAHYFIHEDLKWRNILARQGKGEAELFWIDCPKGTFHRPGINFERKKLKDCATLDKLARLLCTKDERSIFLQAYLGESAQPEEVQKLCRKIEAYRKARFDRKDDQQRKHEKNDH